MKAVVVSGGIGGLAAATALARRRWEAEVLDQTGRFTEAGAGLAVWPNAVRALDALGLRAAVPARTLRPGRGGARGAG